MRRIIVASTFRIKCRSDFRTLKAAKALHKFTQDVQRAIKGGKPRQAGMSTTQGELIAFVTPFIGMSVANIANFLRITKIVRQWTTKQ